MSALPMSQAKCSVVVVVCGSSLMFGEGMLGELRMTEKIEAGHSAPHARLGRRLTRRNSDCHSQELASFGAILRSFSCIWRDLV